MDDLSFARADLDVLGRFFADRPSASSSEWHVTHNLFLPSAEARSAVAGVLEAEGLFVSYLDTIDDDRRPFWLDMMEPVPPDVAAVEARIRRVLATLAAHDGEYNSFSLIGSQGESFPV